MIQVVTVTTAEEKEYLIMEMWRKGTRGSREESDISGLMKASESRSSLCSVSAGFFFKKRFK